MAKQAKPKPEPERIVYCKCGTRCSAELISTGVPGSKPVWFWMCPQCDRK